MSIPSRLVSAATRRAVAKTARSLVSVAPTFQSLSARCVATKIAERATTGRRFLHTIASSRKTSKRRQRIHSSAAASQSAAAVASHLIESPAVSSSAPMPTKSQLHELFVSSAIPMVGFGFMDNFIMIQAGGYIDATLGVKLGLATMTAAAMGQVVSDVSGVVFGGTLESFLQRMNVIKPSNLTNAQRHLPLCRNVAMSGAVLGVIGGCMLGATSLMFIDLETHERQKRAAELHDVLTSMMNSHDEEVLNCEGCTVYFNNATHLATSAQKESEPTMTSLKSVSDDSPVAQCAKSGAMFVDNESMKPVLCAPVFSADGNVMAVVEFRNKLSKSESFFTGDDQRAAKMLARHMGIFMDRLASD